MKQAIITYNGAVFLIDSGSVRNTFGDSMPGRRYAQRQKNMNRILIGIVAVTVFLCCMGTQSYGQVIWQDDFNSYSNFSDVQAGGWNPWITNSVNGLTAADVVELMPSGCQTGKCVRLTYPADNSGPQITYPGLARGGVASFGGEFYVRFYAKLVNKQSSGCKFYKMQGTNDTDPDGGYNNFTMGMTDYNNTNLRGVSYGSCNEGDTQDFARYNNCTNTGSCGGPFGTFQYCRGSSWAWPDENWHKFVIYWKHNTNGNADGIIRQWIDGIEIFHVVNVKTRDDSNPRSFKNILLGDVAQTYTHSQPWYLWYDDFVVGSTYDAVNDGGTSCGGNAPSLSSSSTPDNCGNADGTATVSPTGGSGSYTYLWSNGSTSLTASGLAAGNYTITVTDTDGCSATDNVAVGYTACYSGICLEGEAGTLVFPAESVADATVSQNAYMQTTSGESGTVAYTFNVDTPGTYKLTARVYAAGDGNDSWYFNFDNEAEDIWDFNPTGDASLFGVWYQDELAKRGSGTFDNPEKDPYLVYLTQGSHTFNMRGREAQAKLDYFCLERQITTGTEYIVETAGIVVYPNPTTGELRITNDELRISNKECRMSKCDLQLTTHNLQLFDIYGRVVLEKRHFQISTSAHFQIDHLPAGVYFLTVTTPGGIMTEKVVKY